MSVTEPHTIESAIERGDLNEEEIYFILRFAGRLGYDKAIAAMSNPLTVLRTWLVWIGGWEHPKLSQWDRGKPAWEIFRNGRMTSPFPVAFLGHRIVFQAWLRPRIRTRFGYLCLSGTYCYGLPDKLFWSPDGTPFHKHARIYWNRKVEESEVKP